MSRFRLDSQSLRFGLLLLLVDQGLPSYPSPLVPIRRLVVALRYGAVFEYHKGDHRLNEDVTHRS
jgi:hypothetical protein